MIARSYCDETLPNSRRQTVIVYQLDHSTISLCHLQSRSSPRETPETKPITIFQKITHFRQSSLLFCNSELGLYAEKKISISVFHRQIYCWMRIFFPHSYFCVIQATSKSDGKLVFAPQFLQGIMGSPVVGSTDSCREHLRLSGVPTVVESTHSCPEYRKNLQLSGLPTAVESIFSCREHLQLSKVPPAVKSTSTSPKYLQLSRAPPVVQSIFSCPEHLQLSKVSPVIENISSYREYPQLSRVPPASTCPKYLQLSRVILSDRERHRSALFREYMSYNLCYMLSELVTLVSVELHS